MIDTIDGPQSISNPPLQKKRSARMLIDDDDDVDDVDDVDGSLSSPSCGGVVVVIVAVDVVSVVVLLAVAEVVDEYIGRNLANSQLEMTSH